MAEENFDGLAQQGYYNGLSFHRVIEGFVVQTGDATGTGAAAPPFGTEILIPTRSPTVCTIMPVPLPWRTPRTVLRAT